MLRALQQREERSRGPYAAQPGQVTNVRGGLRAVAADVHVCVDANVRHPGHPRTRHGSASNDAAAVVLIAVPRLPAIYLKRIGKKRAKEMDMVISDVLDLLVVCVEGGQSLSAALMQLSNRMDNVAAEEFRHLLAGF